MLATKKPRFVAIIRFPVFLQVKWNLDLPVLVPSRTPKLLAYSASKPQVQTEGTLRVFPNPAREYTSVEYRIERAFRKAKLEVVDMLGRAVLSQELKQDWNTITLPLRNMQGAHILAITVDEALSFY